MRHGGGSGCSWNRRGIVAEVSGTTVWRWLAEDAIRAAIGDWKKKQESAKPVAVQSVQ